LPINDVGLITGFITVGDVAQGSSAPRADLLMVGFDLTAKNNLARGAASTGRAGDQARLHPAAWSMTGTAWAAQHVLGRNSELPIFIDLPCRSVSAINRQENPLTPACGCPSWWQLIARQGKGHNSLSRAATSARTHASEGVKRWSVASK
jgi:hypothetical protein